MLLIKSIAVFMLFKFLLIYAMNFVYKSSMSVALNSDSVAVNTVKSDLYFLYLISLIEPEGTIYPLIVTFFL